MFADLPRLAARIGEGSVMPQDMLAVLGESQVNFGPLETILDAALECRPGVLGRLAGFPAMRHDLARSRRAPRRHKKKNPAPRGPADPAATPPTKTPPPALAAKNEK